MLKKILSALGGLVAAAVSFLLVGLLLVVILFGTGIPTARPQKESVEVAVGERFRMYMTNQISSALEGIVDIEKVYWLSDSDLAAPKPAEENFGTAKDAASLRWLLEDAREIGYRHMLLDTLPFLKTAISIYKRMGFYEIESYNGSPMEGLVYLKMDL